MKKQNQIETIFLLSFLMLTALSCADKKEDPSSVIDAGTFAGYILVTDDPQTKLGYLTGVKVSVKFNGPKATVKISADSGFDREYSGTGASQTVGSYDISLDKQTRPTEKIAGERVVIMNSKLTIRVDLANDEVTAKSDLTATSTIVIKGKLQLIGADLLKQ